MLMRNSLDEDVLTYTRGGESCHGLEKCLIKFYVLANQTVTIDGGLFIGDV